MAHESLADKAISTVAAIAELERMLADVNDFGDPTGYSQEHQDIAEDAHACLGTLRRRAYTLKRRFERNKVPNTEVSGAPRGELMNRELSARPLDRRVIRRSLTELLRLGPYVREGAETRATMEEAADEIERLREEIGRLLDSREREGDRLDWLLSRLPGSVIRDLVGVMNDTRDAGEWRDLIDKAACFAPHNA